MILRGMLRMRRMPVMGAASIPCVGRHRALSSAPPTPSLGDGERWKRERARLAWDFSWYGRELYLRMDVAATVGR
jgi:hypothetical protein